MKFRAVQSFGGRGLRLYDFTAPQVPRMGGAVDSHRQAEASQQRPFLGRRTRETDAKRARERCAPVRQRSRCKADHGSTPMVCIRLGQTSQSLISKPSESPARCRQTDTTEDCQSGPGLGFALRGLGGGWGLAEDPRSRRQWFDFWGRCDAIPRHLQRNHLGLNLLTALRPRYSLQLGTYASAWNTY